MIELPEAVNLARQLTGRFGGKKIASVEAGHSPHKFVWYYGDWEIGDPKGGSPLEVKAPVKKPTAPREISWGCRVR